MVKPVEYLIMLKNIFDEIIRDFNSNDSSLEYAKKNIGLTIILANCMVRIVPMTTYLKLKKLYDHLTLERVGPNAKWDNFERIYIIYLSEEYSMVVIVSEKLTPIKDSMTMKTKPEFVEREIVKTDRKQKLFTSNKCGSL